MAKHICKRCTYTWDSLLDHPKTCPKCKSYFWDKVRVRKIGTPK